MNDVISINDLRDIVMRCSCGGNGFVPSTSGGVLVCPFCPESRLELEGLVKAKLRNAYLQRDDFTFEEVLKLVTV